MIDQPSRLTRALSRDGSVLVIFADSTAIVQRAHELHNTARTAGAALGRALTVSAIMGSMLKTDNSTLTLQFNGDGPLGNIVCVSDSQGNVRGYVDDPHLELPPTPAGKLDVGGAVGRGNLYVIRDMGLANPYIGYCELVSGEIAEDITHYFAVSEQTPTVCALGVRLNLDDSCNAAGGFLLQLLPLADEAVIPLLERNVHSLESVSALLAAGHDAAAIIAMILRDIPYDVLETTDIEYRCNCSRERYARALLSLGQDELSDLAAAGEPVETCCQFCGERYVFSPSEVADLLAQSQRPQ